MTLELFADNPVVVGGSWSALSAPYTAGATALPVVSNTPYPAADPSANPATVFRVRVDNEILLVTDNRTLTWTVAGAQEGSTAANHASGVSVFVPFTKGSVAGVLATAASDATAKVATETTRATTAEAAAQAAAIAAAATDATTKANAAQAAATAASQPLDSDLTAIAALTTTSFGRALLALADAAAGRTAFGLGTAATQASTAFDAAGLAAAAQAASQPVDSDLTAIAALTTTAYGRAFLALADAAAARTALALGTIATHDATEFLTTSSAGGTYAPLASPALTGTPTAPTQTAGNNSTRLATTAYADGAATTAQAAAVAASSPRLTRTAVKTANYTAAAGDLVPCDTTSAAFTVTLPSAPAVGSRVAVKIVTLGTGNFVTIACGGSDVFNKTAGATTATLQLLGHAMNLQYDTGGIWTVVADDIPKAQLDVTYAPFLPVFTVSTVAGKAMYGPQTPGTTTVGIQEAINAAIAAGGGEVFLFNGTYTLAANTNVGCSAQVTNSTPPANWVHLRLTGESLVNGTPGFAGFPTNGVIIAATPSTGTTVGAVDFFGAKVELTVENIAVVQPVSAHMWHGFSYGVANGLGALFKNCLASQNTYAGAPTSFGAGATDNFNAGFRASNNFFAIHENCATVGYHAGFRGTAQNTYIGCGAAYCAAAYYFPTMATDGDYDHPIRFVNFTASACLFVLDNVSNQTAQIIGDISIEYVTAAGTFQFQNFIYDPSNLLYGDIYLTGHASGGSSPNTTPLTAATLNNNGGANLNVRQVLSGAAAYRMQSQAWYSTPIIGVLATTATVNARATAQPLLVQSSTAFDSIAVNVTIAGGTGSTIRLGIYADNGTGAPGSLVLDAGTVASDSTGQKTIAISKTVPPGLYWLVARDIAVTTQPTVSANPANSTSNLGVFSAAFSPRFGWFSDTVSTPLPAAFPAITAASEASQTYFVMLRAL